MISKLNSKLIYSLDCGNLASVVSHWRMSHKELPLRDLVFMNQLSGVFLQITDIFSHVAVCVDSGHVVYGRTNSGAKTLAEKHETAACNIFPKITTMKSYEFLKASINIMSEEVDEDLDDVVSSLTIAETSNVTGYTCVVNSCGKSYSVSKTSSPQVALNQLKTHFRKVHSNLDNCQFAYKTNFDPLTESPTSSNDTVNVYQCPAIVKGNLIS